MIFGVLAFGTFVIRMFGILASGTFMMPFEFIKFLFIVKFTVALQAHQLISVLFVGSVATVFSTVLNTVPWFRTYSWFYFFRFFRWNAGIYRYLDKAISVCIY